jgi:hypothetical protein
MGWDSSTSHHSHVGSYSSVGPADTCGA